MAELLSAFSWCFLSCSSFLCSLFLCVNLVLCRGFLTCKLAEIFGSCLNSKSLWQKKKDEKIDNYFVEMEISLNERLGRRVKVDYGRNKGALILEFYNKEDLAALAEKLTVEE